jgi:hypothetical protein
LSSSKNTGPWAWFPGWVEKTALNRIAGSKYEHVYKLL